MIHTRVLHADGSCRTDVAAESLHPFVENQRNVFWIDLESPTPDELGLVGGLLGWQHLTVEDVAKQGQRAKLEPFDGYTYLVMHQLSYEGTPARLVNAEVDFIIGTNYVATVHYVPVPSIAQALGVAHQLSATLGRGRDYLLYTLADELVDSYFPVLDAMHEAVDDLEDEIVGGAAQSLMSRIFEMKRDAVSLRKIVSPQLEVFSRLTSPGLGIISEEHVVYFRDVHDHLIRVFEAMDSYRELMSGALDAYLSTVSNRMNEVMKRLTVMAALFLPITFFTGVFGMNLRETPIWHDPIFWIFLAGMAIASIGQFLYFRRKGWA
jgi:magnesium transporter